MTRQQQGFGQRGVAKAPNPYTGEFAARPSRQVASSYDDIDENLRAFMLQVYNYMGAGLLVTALAAFLTYWLTVTTDPSLAASIDGDVLQITKTEYLTELGVMLWLTPLHLVVCFGPLALLIFTCGMWRSISGTAGLIVFMVVAALIGVSFSALGLIYTNGSIAKMFFATATGFGGLSLIGYTTKKDLSGWGSFLWMGLFGLLGVMIYNLIWPSEMLQFGIAVVGVIVFAGFTAYDTQMIKQAYSDRLTAEDTKRLAVQGALDLYLDFINMFRFLLYLFGSRE